VIDFRYHLVSIVAVFLALAIGIVLGSTELQGPTFNILNHTTATLQNEIGQVTSERNTAQQQADLGEAYAQAIEPVVLRDLLPGQRVLIVSEPGAQAEVVSGIAAAAIDAGASVTGQIHLQQKFFDTSATARDTLNQTTVDVAQPLGITLTSTDSFQQQAAQVIASEILLKSPGSATPTPTPTPTSSTNQVANAQTMLTAYASSGFLNITGQPATPATLVVVVTPQNTPSNGSADQLGQVLVPLVAELAAKSAATVVAGSSAGSGSGSPIAVLRSTNVANQVSTIDDADLVSGQTVTIQALAALLEGGKAASYGYAGNGATAVAPSPGPTPTASPTATATSSNKKAKK
jgi:hypothetical protein